MVTKKLPIEDVENGILLQFRPGHVAVPHVFSRSNLFEIYSRTVYDDLTKVVSDSRYDISIKGESLSVYDFNVYISLLNMCGEQNIPGKDFYKDIRINKTLGDLAAYMNDKRTTGNAHNILASLLRLSSTVIQIKDGGLFFSGSLLSVTGGTYKDKPVISTGTKVSVAINKDLQAFYLRGNWAAANLAVLRALGRDNIAIRLYLFFLSFRNSRSATLAFAHAQGEHNSARFNIPDLSDLHFYGLDILQDYLGVPLPAHKFAQRIFQAAQKIQNATFANAYLPSEQEIKVSKTEDKQKQFKDSKRVKFGPKYAKDGEEIRFYMVLLDKPKQNAYGKHKYKLAADFFNKQLPDRVKTFAVVDCTWAEMKKKMAYEAEHCSNKAISAMTHEYQVEKYSKQILDALASPYELFRS